MSTPITDAARQTIKDFVRDNIGVMSARDCAAALDAMGYNVSRNAVMGIAYRGGFPMQKKNKGKKRSPRPRTVATFRPRRDGGVFASSVAKKEPDKVLVKAFAVTTTPTNPVSLAELNDGTCRWPLGEFAARPPYFFCGGPVFVGCYCMGHYQRSILGKSKETNHDVAADGARAGL